jgi:hypothetical protein
MDATSQTGISMRVLGLSLAIVLVAAPLCVATPGDTWVLGIHHIQDAPAGLITNNGAGYSGPRSSGDPNYSGKAVGYNGTHGQFRVYWELSGNSVNDGDPLPNSVQLYSLQFYGATDVGHDQWQPVESQLNGAGGEVFPIDSGIPWNGASNTNHQYIAANGSSDGQWHNLGTGPHTPESASPSAGSNGLYMWLKPGSWLYAKWDFTGATDRTWSALRLTQISAPVVPIVDGDYSKNGFVDAADYVMWRKTYFDFGDNLPADGNQDRFIDDLDYVYWRGLFGNGASGAASDLSSGAVPEPTAFVLTVLAGIVTLACSRGRRVKGIAD